jgi:hypothetical protein
LSDHYGLRTAFQWSLRSPEFLLADDPIVIKRQKLALDSLGDALEVLQRDGRTSLKPAIALLKKWKFRFERNLPQSLERMYRLR